MKLYNLPLGMNPRRVRIFLAEKGVGIETVDIDMMKGENRTPEFLAMNPMGTLPVLELDDGTILSESIAICRYLEHLHPEPALFGSTPLAQAQVEMWNRRMEYEIMAPITAVFRHANPFWEGRITQVPDFADVARAQASERMLWLDGHLSDREFIATDTYTVADITAQCALLLGRNTSTPIPDEAANLTRWWKGVTARPSARA